MKKRTFERLNFFEYEIVRGTDKLVITEVDFRRINPSELYSIVMKLINKSEQNQTTKDAYLAAKTFLHQILEEFSLQDGEMFNVMNNHPEDQYRDLVDLSMPEVRENWRKGATNDPMLGIIYKDKSRKGTLLFFLAKQIRRAPSAMLEGFIKAMKKTSHSDPEAKKEMLERMEWMLNVIKFWGYAWK